MSNLASQFRHLHSSSELLILPNAWDAGSARLFEDVGAKAIATTSAGVGWALGYPDGNVLPPEKLAALVETIRRAIHVPLVALYLNRRLRSQGVHDLNTVNYCT